jgi:hypothetical protein
LFFRFVWKRGFGDVAGDNKGERRKEGGKTEEGEEQERN